MKYFEYFIIGLGLLFITFYVGWATVVMFLEFMV